MSVNQALVIPKLRHIGPCDNLTCQKCCNHFDLDAKYVCLNCDHDLSEEISQALDEADLIRKEYQEEIA